MKKGEFKTKLGKYIIGDSVEVLKSKDFKKYKGKVQLILTSPPFPLNEKKRYGNFNGEKYKNWFISLANIFSEYLTDNGSIVVELGNAWEPGRPVQSLLPLESLLGFVNNEQAGLRLCQQFVCYNPSRLPSPAPWVTINRIRTIDSYTHVWWMSKSDWPQADNSRVLRPYSKSMKELLVRKSYNSGIRPSQHNIGKRSFLHKNSGSIMHNVLELEQIDENRDLRLPKNMFSIANTKSNTFFLNECRKRGITPHPARMQPELASFFIEFLTKPGDLILDPFAGTNTTGFFSEVHKRKWLSIEIDTIYSEQAKIRFNEDRLSNKKE